MRQAGVIACLIIRASRLVIELQRKLDISRRLRHVGHAGCGCGHRRIGSCKVYAVEGVQKIAAELQLKAFGQVKVLLKTEIPVVQTGATQLADLRCASAERRGWVAVVAGIKPKDTAPLSGG